MPFFFVFLLTPIVVAIALYRRDPRRFVDGPTEDAPLRLLRWAIGLLSPQRAEWGQACSANSATSSLQLSGR